MKFLCRFGLRGKADTQELVLLPRAHSNMFVLSLATPCSLLTPETDASSGSATPCLKVCMIF